MRIDQSSQTKQNTIPQQTKENNKNEFSDVLLTKLSRPSLIQSHLSFDFEKDPIRIPESADSKTFLGTINDATPTVSEVLHQHIQYADTWWQIIHAKANKGIDYQRLQPGTEVYLEKNSGALILAEPGEQRSTLPAKPPGESSPIAGEDNALSSPPTETGSISSTKSPPYVRLSLGTIDADAPTVSHLLRGNERTSADTWRILQNPLNRQKNFENILPGTEIFLDFSSGELFWSSPTSKAVADNENLHSEPRIGPNPSPENTAGASQPVSLGKISTESPTVSHLLVSNRDFREKTWQIIFSDLNRQKQFTTLRKGTEIFLRPDTGELLWGEGLKASAQAPLPSVESLQEVQPMPALASPNTAPSDETKTFSSRLAKAVQPYFGRPYNEIDCYGLVIRGLRRMGIKYLGSGGIRDRLVHLALERGLPPNAFFNGEGLIEATGEKIFSRTFQQVHNVDEEAGQLFSDIAPQLRRGDILSFSTQSNGHTGIISNRAKQWTFINSGDMDNTVSGANHPEKGVGEEDLQAEIKNWLQKAHSERQSLKITIGRLQEEKLRAAMQRQSPILSSTL